MTISRKLNFKNVSITSKNDDGTETVHGLQPQIPQISEPIKNIEPPAQEIIRPNPSLKTTKPFEQRITLPSGGLLYEADVKIRPFGVHEVVMMSKALKTNQITSIYDALDNTLDVNVRELCLPDVRFLLYWHRLNSYPKRPFTINTKSIYGNDIKTEIKQTNLAIETMKTNENLYYYLTKFTWPTIADSEAQALLVGKVDDFILSRAPFVKASSFKEKLELFETLDMDDLCDIADFSKLFNFGVRETINVIDKNFNYAKAIEFLENRLDLCRQQKDILKSSDSLYAHQLRIEEENILDELHRLSEKGEGATAKVEIHNFYLDVADFFPDI